jgi:hypothetical protein
MPKWLVVVFSLFAAYGALHVALSLFFSLGGLAFVGGPGSRSCFSYPVMSVPSPTGEFVVEVENTSCAPANKLMTNVWVMRTGSNESSMVLVAPSAQTSEGSYFPLNMLLTWEGESQLKVSYPRDTKVESKPAELDSSITLSGVKVSYAELHHNPL